MGEDTSLHTAEARGLRWSFACRRLLWQIRGHLVLEGDHSAASSGHRELHCNSSSKMVDFHHRRKRGLPLTHYQYRSHDTQLGNTHFYPMGGSDVCTPALTPSSLQYYLISPENALGVLQDAANIHARVWSQADGDAKGWRGFLL